MSQCHIMSGNHKGLLLQKMRLICHGATTRDCPTRYGIEAFGAMIFKLPAFIISFHALVDESDLARLNVDKKGLNKQLCEKLSDQYKIDKF
ncbi:hypothetical protein PN36_33140 [Candidatus Thiomargarita nelsonii]|uniref:Uncharacterized protein n=1 Tax=Candidatus Thiomargarita nelsonii TaxID=1003181 RepID=A0A4E0QK14_9GAMM|nr:hypothetical protein PN36_33140 [Candidatus Thiomargarita nelsonii]